MLLGLVRDRAALAMSFLLPAIFFLIFATIFSGATGEQLRLKIAIADEVRSEASMRLIDALRADPALLPTGDEDLNGEQVRALVRHGTADAGIIVREGDRPGTKSLLQRAARSGAGKCRGVDGRRVPRADRRTT
jgi:ABC-2 type transport system permease protein